VRARTELFIPLLDPRVYERYPGGVVSEGQRLSPVE